jgi:PEGA domain-containing protein
LRVQPGDATVYIDGEPWRGPQTQDRLVIQLAEGSHRVRVEKPGFQTFSVDVDVRAGETASFNVSLLSQ